jgi:hypothetical protein
MYGFLTRGEALAARSCAFAKNSQRQRTITSDLFATISSCKCKIDLHARVFNGMMVQCTLVKAKDPEAGISFLENRQAP